MEGQNGARVGEQAIASWWMRANGKWRRVRRLASVGVVALLSSQAPFSSPDTLFPFPFPVPRSRSCSSRSCPSRSRPAVLRVLFQSSVAPAAPGWRSRSLFLSLSPSLSISPLPAIHPHGPVHQYSPRPLRGNTKLHLPLARRPSGPLRSRKGPLCRRRMGAPARKRKSGGRGLGSQRSVVLSVPPSFLPPRPAFSSPDHYPSILTWNIPHPRPMTVVSALIFFLFTPRPPPSIPIISLLTPSPSPSCGLRSRPAVVSGPLLFFQAPSSVLSHPLLRLSYWHPPCPVRTFLESWPRLFLSLPLPFSFSFSCTISLSFHQQLWRPPPPPNKYQPRPLLQGVGIPLHRKGPRRVFRVPLRRCRELRRGRWGRSQDRQAPQRPRLHVEITPLLGRPHLSHRLLLLHQP